MKRILFVCHGNICRSPMAEFVMKDLVNKAGRADDFYIESAATSTEEIGNEVYPPARRKLAEHGISCKGKTARQMTRADYARFDLLIGMDSWNLRNMLRICGNDPEGKIHLLLDFTSRPGDVADPWYTGDFEATWRDVLEGCKNLLSQFPESKRKEGKEKNDKGTNDKGTDGKGKDGKGKDVKGKDKSKKTLVVVTGPTAVGKTELCLWLARQLGTPIINADSRQIYKGLQIGTAAPTAEQLQQVRHYFVGMLELDQYYSASMYEQQATELLKQLFLTSDYALMAGGSMMYIDAVCNGIDDIPTVDDDTRQLMKRRLEEEGLEALCEELRRLDPEHYDIVDRQNPRRVVHALEICHMTGRTYTSYRRNLHKERPFNIRKIGLTLPREQLYERINRRVDRMMADGLLDEARRLLPLRHLNALNTVGYKEMFAHLDGTWSLDEAVERLKGNTRRYARKQLTWFKKDPQVKWFLPDDKENIISYIQTGC